MSQEMIAAQVLAADEARYQALYAQDVQALGPMLHEDYLHIHANGKADTKEAFLASIGAAKYRFVLAERSRQQVRFRGPVAILSGETRTTIDLAGGRQTMHNAFTTVWTAEADRWKLLQWQATKIPEAVAS